MTKTNEEQPKPLTAQQKRSILTRAKTQTAPQIAVALNLPVSRVRRHLLRSGVRAKNAAYAPLDGVDVAKAIEKHGSVAKVADHYGVTRQAVHRRLALAAQP